MPFYTNIFIWLSVLKPTNKMHKMMGEKSARAKNETLRIWSMWCFLFNSISTVLHFSIYILCTVCWVRFTEKLKFIRISRRHGIKKRIFISFLIDSEASWMRHSLRKMRIEVFSFLYLPDSKNQYPITFEETTIFFLLLSISSIIEQSLGNSSSSTERQRRINVDIGYFISRNRYATTQSVEQLLF